MEEKNNFNQYQGRDSAVRLSTSKPYFTETIYQNQKKQISDINEKFKTIIANSSNNENEKESESR